MNLQKEIWNESTSGADCLTCSHVSFVMTISPLNTSFEFGKLWVILGRPVLNAHSRISPLKHNDGHSYFWSVLLWPLVAASGSALLKVQCLLCVAKPPVWGSCASADRLCDPVSSLLLSAPVSMFGHSADSSGFQSVFILVIWPDSHSDFTHFTRKTEDLAIVRGLLKIIHLIFLGDQT